MKFVAWGTRDDEQTLSGEMQFHQHDLSIVNPLELIRSNREMYLPEGPSAERLTERLVGDILVVPDRFAIAVRRNDWRIVASDKDWIGKIASPAVIDHFTNIVPFPEYGPNSMHGEVLVTAFASDVITFLDSDELVIKGAADTVVRGLIGEHPEWKRAIAFRIFESPTD